jgi:large subunit ribosomal protein L25
MDKKVLNAEKRTLVGRKVKTLRREGALPANVFGRNVKSVSVQVNAKEFERTFAVTGETGLVELTLGKEKKPVLIHNVQTDPVTDTILHVDFLQVDLKQKVTAQVPLELVGESPAEKQGLGTVVQYLNELEVQALPTDLPDKFEIDLTKLSEVDQMVQVKDVKIDKAKVEIQEGGDEIIVKVEPPKEEEKEEVVAPMEEGVAEEAESGEPEGGGESPEQSVAGEPGKKDQD